MRNRAIALGSAGALGLTMLAPLTASGAAGEQADSATIASSQVSASADTCPRLVAHRGGDENPPDTNENSMAAFKRAANLGVWAIETDVWFTKDLVPVIMHDETIDRTTNGTGKISDYTYKQLEQFRLNNGEKIPSLDKVLQLVKDRGIWGFIEYKDADEKKLYKIYLKHLEDSGAKVYGAGFSSELMEWLHKKDKNLPLMWFGNRTGSIPIPTPPQDVPTGADPGLINWFIDTQLVDEMAAAGKKVNVWFNTATKGDNPSGSNGLGPAKDKGWNALTAAGVTWISTDFPDNYNAWMRTGGVCDAPAPKKAKAPCVMMPKSKDLQAGRTYKVMTKGCKSTAAKKVKLQVKAKNSVATKVGKNNNKVKIKKLGPVTIKVKAKKRTASYNGVEWNSYTSFKKERVWSGGLG
ncbi:MAG: glycerophosphodiester phosphodiesterase family protein [Actinomycetia bacterium]|nr:glycerophosphodiester phosphodiesterase family protein [Actinomycetes bacterium]